MVVALVVIVVAEVVSVVVGAVVDAVVAVPFSRVLYVWLLGLVAIVQSMRMSFGFVEHVVIDCNSGGRRPCTNERDFCSLVKCRKTRGPHYYQPTALIREYDIIPVVALMVFTSVNLSND